MQFSQEDLDRIARDPSIVDSYPLPPNGTKVEDWALIDTSSELIHGEPVLIIDPEDWYAPRIGIAHYNEDAEEMVVVELDNTGWFPSEIDDADILIYAIRVLDDPICRDAKPSIGDLI